MSAVFSSVDSVLHLLSLRRHCVPLLLLLAVGLTDCTNTLEVSSLEAEIKATLEKQRGINVKSVVCPRDLPREAEGYFECEGQLDPQGEFTVTATQQDDQGNVE